MNKSIIYLQEGHPHLSETFLRAEINELFDRDYPVGVVTFKVNKDIVEACRYKSRIVEAPWADDEEARLSSLATLVAEQNPRYLHSHFLTEARNLTLPVAEKLGIPFGFTCHAYDIWRLGHRVEPEELHRIANHKLCITAATIGSKHKEFLLACCVQEEKIVITPNVVDTNILPPPKTEYSKGIQNIVAVGRAVPKKGFFTAMDALRLLHLQGHKDKRLTIIGGGDQSTEIGQLVLQFVEAFSFIEATPLIPNAEVLERVRSADLLLAPSVPTVDGDSDGIPTVLPEAMLLGVPVISTDVGSITDLVVHEETGFIARAGDPGSLAKQILSAEALLQKEGSFSLLVERAKNQARRHSGLSSVNNLSAHLETQLGRFD